MKISLKGNFLKKILLFTPILFNSCTIEDPVPSNALINLIGGKFGYGTYANFGITKHILFDISDNAYIYTGMYVTTNDNPISIITNTNSILKYCSGTDTIATYTGYQSDERIKIVLSNINNYGGGYYEYHLDSYHNTQEISFNWEKK